MSYTVENVNGCTKKLVFNFETLDLSTEIAQALKKKQKSVKLKGFREGKAPISMVEQMYKPQVENDALQSFVQNRLYDAITKEDLKVVGYPAFENMKYDAGKSVSFEAVVEIFPDVEVKDMSKLKFKKDSADVDTDELKKSREGYLQSRAEMVEIKEDVALESGQTAVMNFEGVKPDGERPDNMKGEEFLLEIGSGQFIPGFEDGMVGMKKGEKRDVKVTFPAEYHEESLKNADVTFEVELLEIKEKKLPELTDELAKEFGYESVEDFNTKTEKQLASQKERQVLEKLHQEILEKLIEENSFEVPSALREQQLKHVKQDLSQTLQQQGFNEEMMAEYFVKWKEDLDKKADFQVRSGLILETLAKKFNIETTDADFDAKLEEVASSAGMDVEQVKSFYTSNPQGKKNMMYALREEKTFEEIKKIVTVS